MKRSFQIADLIVAFIKGEISREELALLDAWLEQSEENKALFVSFMDEAVFGEEKNRMPQAYLEEVFADLKRRKDEIRQREQWRRQRRLRRFRQMAAVVIVGLGVSWWLWKDLGMSTETPVQQEAIQVGVQKACLVLASGERVVLSGRQQDTIRVGKAGEQIIIGEGEVRMADSEEREEKAGEYNIMEVPRGAEYSLILADGSRVWLNADSKLKFPSAFRGDRRVVELSGEAYFAVRHDEEKPFVVHSGEVEVTVLGTEFCIRQYQGKPTLTTLVQGRVEVADQEGWKAVLKPGQQVVTQGGKSVIREVEPIYYTAWKDGYFIFENTPLEEIMTQLSLWYNCEVSFKDQVAADLRMTARLKKYEEIDVLLDILSKTRDVVFEKQGRTILVRKK